MPFCQMERIGRSILGLNLLQGLPVVRLNLPKETFFLQMHLGMQLQVQLETKNFTSYS